MAVITFRGIDILEGFEVFEDVRTPVFMTEFGQFDSINDAVASIKAHVPAFDADEPLGQFDLADTAVEQVGGVIVPEFTVL